MADTRRADFVDDDRRHVGQQALHRDEPAYGGRWPFCRNGLERRRIVQREIACPRPPETFEVRATADPLTKVVRERF